jgi:hypothetical protein
LAINAGGSLTATTINNNGTLSTASTGALTATTLTSTGTVDMTSGGTITIANNGSFTNSTFNYGTGKVVFSGSGTSTFSGITNFYDVAISGGVNFSGTTINDTLTINTGGYVNTTAPTYASTSCLKYNVNTTYGRNTEWSATSNAGYPAHVRLSNSTVLDLGANSAQNTAFSMAGNLTIDAGSTLTMNGGTTATGSQAIYQPLTVGGGVTNNGTLKLGTNNSNISYGDIKVTGDWNNA